MRVKTGSTRLKRHNKIRKLARGYRGRRKDCYSLAKRAVDRAWSFAYRDRRRKKREFRSLWIIRINAAAREAGLSYSKLVQGLKAAGVVIDRKILAELAVCDAAAFGQIADKAKAAIGN
ncbi:MAG: 50S ribosomal protein L20 [Deltaproteobacteria bacterium]|nr:50S ribosomal protein L20 [Deltaproteobacteria bacterium]